MKLSNLLFTTVSLLVLNSCASGYKNIEPKTLNFNSTNTTEGVSLAYKYDLLDKKYKKKESKNNLKLVAVKITNSTDKDLVFGSDIKITTENGSEIFLLENDVVYKTIKQSPASYLWYLLLSPMNFMTTKTNTYGQPETTSTTPVGLILGPGLAAGNMIAASSANTKFKKDLLNYNIVGTTIKKGETAYGLIGIKSNNYDSLKLKF
ncbi:hypothetical protein [Flavobacterium sp. K5-23]|uniref:hypothetical protein n=1 Tax=Flavobacterium sp. K5-23 TaxID=2746225 RepID=UPI00200C1F18|nr:hypothetical protein [Flavobacterium sp. K5-23]UQD56762.1 hypothetical protein FLAK523_10320 [Flavobacterium sp. K5-23]